MKTLPAKLAVASERYQPLALEWGSRLSGRGLCHEKGAGRALVTRSWKKVLANGEEIRTGAIDAAKMRVLEEWSA